jgi:hypothetical protein
VSVVIDDLAGEADAVLKDLDPHIAADSPPRTPMSYLIAVKGTYIENQYFVGYFFNQGLKLKEIFAIVNQKMGKTVRL